MDEPKIDKVSLRGQRVAVRPELHLVRDPRLELPRQNRGASVAILLGCAAFSALLALAAWIQAALR